MADIVRGLYWYLVEDESHIMDDVRRDARETLRHELRRKDGSVAIYEGPIEQNKQAAQGRLAVTLAELAERKYQAPKRRSRLTTLFVDVDIWAKAIPYRVIKRVKESLDNCLINQSEQLWLSDGVELRVDNVSHENFFKSDLSPQDASDDWLLNYVLSYRIGYAADTVPA